MTNGEILDQLLAEAEKDGMTDLVERLRDTPNWMRESYGSWKDGTLKYDRAPFEAADEIERLRAELADALDLKSGTGPTALGMVAADRDRLKAEIAAAQAVIEQMREKVYLAIEKTWYEQAIDMRGANISEFMTAIRSMK